MPTLQTRKRQYKAVLSKQEALLAKLIAENPNTPIKTNAIKAGYGVNYASTGLYQKLDSPKMQEAIEDIRERNAKLAAKFGKTAENRIKKFCDLSDATKPLVLPDVGDVIYIPDNTAQVAAAKELSKLCGDYPAEKLELPGISFESMLEQARCAQLQVKDLPDIEIVEAEVVSTSE